PEQQAIPRSAGSDQSKDRRRDAHLFCNATLSRQPWNQSTVVKIADGSWAVTVSEQPVEGRLADQQLNRAFPRGTRPTRRPPSEARGRTFPRSSEPVPSASNPVPVKSGSHPRR